MDIGMLVAILSFYYLYLAKYFFHSLVYALWPIWKIDPCTMFLAGLRGNSFINQLCNITATVNGQAVYGKEMYTFAVESTPKITAVSPERGGTMGGTEVTITGELFGGDPANVMPCNFVGCVTFSYGVFFTTGECWNWWCCLWCFIMQWYKYKMHYKCEGSKWSSQYQSYSVRKRRCTWQWNTILLHW